MQLLARAGLRLKPTAVAQILADTNLLFETSEKNASAALDALAGVLNLSRETLAEYLRPQINDSGRELKSTALKPLNLFILQGFEDIEKVEDLASFSQLLVRARFCENLTQADKILDSVSQATPLSDGHEIAFLSAVAERLNLSLAEMVEQLHDHLPEEFMGLSVPLIRALKSDRSTLSKTSSEQQTLTRIAKLVVKAGITDDVSRTSSDLADLATNASPITGDATTFLDALAARYDLDRNTLIERLKPHVLAQTVQLPEAFTVLFNNDTDEKNKVGEHHRTLTQFAELILRSGVSDDPEQAKQILFEVAITDPPIKGSESKFLDAVAERYELSRNELAEQLEPYLVEHEFPFQQPMTRELEDDASGRPDIMKSKQLLSDIVHLLRKAGVALEPIGLSQLLLEVMKTNPLSDGNEVAFLDTLARRLDLSRDALIRHLRPHVSSHSGTLPQALLDVIQQTVFSEHPIGSDSTDASETAETAIPSNAPIFTPMSGLVLTHPYLTTYLDRLGCLENGQLPKEHTDRAVHLFGLLASGRSDLPEHELMLPKLLANLSVTSPVSHGYEVKSEESELADELLRHLASQVPGFVNTTPDALRETFLMRHGQIIPSSDESGMVLRVVKGPFDMLLNDVPWPFSIIRLPWMQEALHVEWI